MRNFGIVLMAVVGMGAGAGFGGPKTYPYKAVCTTGMIADVVRNVGGKEAAVTALMGEGVDPHLYKPTRDDALKLLEADVVFYNGLLLEGRMTDTFTKVARKGTPVFAVTEKIDETMRIEPDGATGHPDPHVWMDVRAWQQATEVVRDALAEIDPSNKAAYDARAAAYIEQLSKLDDYVRGVIASIPKDRRVLVTAHDAFNYFSRAYGIEVRGIQGISTESEAGVADVNRLVEFLVERKIPAIFVETSVSDKNVMAVIEGARAQGHAVKIGGQLFSDAMGGAGSYEGTYIGMIDHNATTIARALGGTAPEKGMQGKLK